MRELRGTILPSLTRLFRLNAPCWSSIWPASSPLSTGTGGRRKRPGLAQVVDAAHAAIVAQQARAQSTPACTQRLRLDVVGAAALRAATRCSARRASPPRRSRRARPRPSRARPPRRALRRVIHDCSENTRTISSPEASTMRNRTARGSGGSRCGAARRRPTRDAVEVLQLELRHPGQHGDSAPAARRARGRGPATATTRSPGSRSAGRRRGAARRRPPPRQSG